MFFNNHPNSFEKTYPSFKKNISVFLERNNKLIHNMLQYQKSGFPFQIRKIPPFLLWAYCIFSPFVTVSLFMPFQYLYKIICTNYLLFPILFYICLYDKNKKNKIIHF